MEDYPGTIFEFEERFRTEESSIALAGRLLLSTLWASEIMDDEAWLASLLPHPWRLCGCLGPQDIVGTGVKRIAPLDELL